MLNLFEILQSSQNGAAVEALARQHGLTPKQAETAIDVLLPAFTLALQRQAQNPQGWLGLMSAFQPATATGSPLEAAGRTFTAEGMKQGADVMTRLFGSNDLSQQIAAQSAAVSGVPAQILQQMMPAMAAMLASGMLKTFSQEGLAGVVAAMTRGFPSPAGAAVPPPPLTEPEKPSALESYMDAFQQMVKAMAPLPAANTPPEPEPPPPPKPEEAVPNPFDPAGFGSMLKAMLGGGTEPAKTAPEPEPVPEPEPPPTAAEDAAAAMGQLFETGRAVQEQHLAALNALFAGWVRPGETAKGG